MSLRFGLVGDFDGNDQEEIAVTPTRSDSAGNDFWTMKFDEDHQWKHTNPNYREHPIEADLDCSGLDYAAKFGVSGDFDGDDRDELAIAPDVSDSGGNDFWTMEFDPNSRSWGHMSPGHDAHPMDADLDCSGLGFAAKFGVSGDFDGDGHDELAIAPDVSGSGGNDFWTMEFDPNSRSWGHMSPGHDAHPVDADLDCSGLDYAAKFGVSGDFDGDGRDELAIAPNAPESAGNDFWTMEFDPNSRSWGHMSPGHDDHPMDADLDCSGGPYPATFAMAGDFDGDGRDEIAVAASRSSAGEHHWLMKFNTDTRSWDRISTGTWGEPATGEWTLLDETLGFAGVHVALLHTGKVLFFSYDDDRENDVDVGFWQLWDPSTGITDEVRVMDRNLFCSGHCFLPDGRLLVAGGQSYNWAGVGRGADHDIHTFNPENETWTRREDMPRARYYPTCGLLPDGRALIVGGAASRVPFLALNDEVEFYDYEKDRKSDPKSFNPGHVDKMYPFLQVLPDGSPRGTVFVYADNEARLYDPQRGTWGKALFRTTSKYNRNYPQAGSCVLLPVRPNDTKYRILVVGGAGEEGDQRATANAEIFEFNPNSPDESYWRSAGTTQSRRFMSDSVLLPDGNVLVVNGAGRGTADHSHDGIMEAELFDSEAETWTTLASINNPRLYHSAAILLPDARVLVCGNTRHWNPGNEIEDPTLEVFDPPYLSRGERPQLIEAPEIINYNKRFVLQVANAEEISRVAFIRPSSTTHTNNMDQRYIEAALVERDEDEIIVESPRNTSVAPPGYYMLFILNSMNVPSVAKFVHLSKNTQEQSLIVDKNVTVKEEDHDVDTGIDFLPGDDYSIESSGRIKPGVFGTSWNGPNGWNNVDHDKKFPLHEGPDAHPFALVARFGGGKYYFVGEKRQREEYPHAESRRLYLRINDDTPGNGEGSFDCRIKVWR